MALEIAKAFPTEDFMAELNNGITEFRTIQGSITEHFKSIMGTFNDMVKELNKPAPERENSFNLIAEE